jgi:pimeloyl-ACP methyl ester carboxylesterase
MQEHTVGTETKGVKEMPRRAANSKLALRGTWLATQALGLVSPRLSGRPASVLWFTPWRLPQSEGSRARETEWLRGSKPFKVAGLQGFVAGEGPVILLVHGWGGWASRLGAFVRPLVETGRQVVAMDLPAHGSSPGSQTNPFEMAEALLKVAGSAGPIHALISHSFGGLVSLLAMERGLKPGTAVFLAPALRAGHVRARFAEIEPAWQTLFRNNVLEWKELATSPDTFPDLDQDRVRQLRVPTLVLSGGKNAGGFNDRVDARLHELIPGARRVVLPDASHEMFLDSPELSARAMLDHFAAHRDRR